VSTPKPCSPCIEVLFSFIPTSVSGSRPELFTDRSFDATIAHSGPLEPTQLISLSLSLRSTVLLLAALYTPLPPTFYFSPAVIAKLCAGPFFRRLAASKVSWPEVENIRESLSDEFVSSDHAFSMQRSWREASLI